MLESIFGLELDENSQKYHEFLWKRRMSCLSIFFLLNRQFMLQKIHINSFWRESSENGYIELYVLVAYMSTEYIYI